MVLLATMNVIPGDYTREKIKNKNLPYGPIVVKETPELLSIIYSNIKNMITIYYFNGDTSYEQVDAFLCTDCEEEFLKTCENYTNRYGCDTHYVDKEGFEIYEFIDGTVEICYKDIYNFYMVIYDLERYHEAMRKIYRKQIEEKYELDTGDNNE
jgi:hypothetical protein